MDLSSAVRPTRELSAAREKLQYADGLRRAGLRSTLAGVLPELTDQECAVLSQEFEAYTYESIRRAFPLRVVEGKR